jgi:membrane-bound lytic murein transglycosylase B
MDRREFLALTTLFVLDPYEAVAKPKEKTPEMIKKGKAEPFSVPLKMSRKLEQLVEETRYPELGDLLKDSRARIYPEIHKRFATEAEIERWRAEYASWPEEKKRQYIEKAVAKFKERISFDQRCKGINGFVREYQADLMQSNALHGTPQQLTAAIIGVESAFGRILGRHNPLNAFVSLYLNAEDRRAKWARYELMCLMHIASSSGVDVFTLKSSYAGAMGPAQFIPSSVIRFFKGGDVNSMTHSIHAVARYLEFYHMMKGTWEEAVFEYNNLKAYEGGVMDMSRVIEVRMMQAAMKPTI